MVRSIGHLESLKRQLITSLSSSNSNQEAAKQPRVISSTRLPGNSPELAVTTIEIQQTQSEQAAHLAAFGGQMQMLHEDIKRMVLPNIAATSASLPETTDAIHQMKTEIVSEMKVELHSFAEQLMQYIQHQHAYMEQQQHQMLEAKIRSDKAIPKILVSNTGDWQSQTVSEIPTDELRNRIGGVSVPFQAATGDLALPGVRRIQWLKKHDRRSSNSGKTFPTMPKQTDDLEK